MSPRRTLKTFVIMMLVWEASTGDSSDDDEDDSVDMDEYEDDPAETGSSLDTTGIIDSEEGFQDNGQLKGSKETTVKVEVNF